MKKELRLFFAVQFEDELHIALTNLIKELRKEKWGHRVRWVHPENLHLTLRFIGGSESEQVSTLVEKVTTAIKIVKSFSLTLNKIHFFPSPDKPQVISMGIVPNRELFQLVEKIEEGVVAAGIRSEKRGFLPHITLGRVTHRPVLLTPEKYQPPITELVVKEVVLLHSEKTEHGQIYQELNKIILQSN